MSTAKRGDPSDRIDIKKFAKLLDFLSPEEAQDRLSENSPGGFENEKEESEWMDEEYSTYYFDLVGKAESLFEAHGLTLVAKPRSKKDRFPWEYRIVPTTNWAAAAGKLLQTINGVGDFSFSSLKDFLDSGPYTARVAVLSHLGYLGSYRDVYGYWP